MHKVNVLEYIKLYTYNIVEDMDFIVVLYIGCTLETDCRTSQQVGIYHGYLISRGT
jgi:hypothetical protein